MFTDAIFALWEDTWILNYPLLKNTLNFFMNFQKFLFITDWAFHAPFFKNPELFQHLHGIILGMLLILKYLARK